ncbi:SCO2584 family spore wall biosynthesis protein [Streptomyces sp. NBC_01803]|uniref:SCO2584 family spore wall biosynthesis protein n=1 Tax=Streptomyces sp. NBC_01803 TaxID=2975946 RepID=UPI002DDABB95|nr:hypothetical protein [Streptomyces sp. NBC_01803]WSA46239.1 hypothetical protein OIE51_19840 [Streptomyces sp. NBC_01803]
MPDDVGGQPFPNGEGPDSHDLGAAEEAFASVVLDEAFVEAARIHEPTAAERILYAAMERAESEAGGEVGFYRDPDLDPGASDGLGGFDGDDDVDDEGRFDRSDYTRYLPDEDDEDRPTFGSFTAYGGYGADGIRGPGGREAQPPPAAWRPAPRPRGGLGGAPGRWQRPVACVLAMVMGISVIAFALIAIQRAGAAQPRVPGPPAPASESDGDGGGRTTEDVESADNGPDGGP